MLTVYSNYEDILSRNLKYFKDTAIKGGRSSVLGHRWQWIRAPTIKHDQVQGGASELGEGETMRTHTTATSVCGCETSSKLWTNHRARTIQSEFQQLNGVTRSRYLVFACNVFRSRSSSERHCSPRSTRDGMTTLSRLKLRGISSICKLVRINFYLKCLWNGSRRLRTKLHSRVRHVICVDECYAYQNEWN
jgi:hypothetical protein